MECTGLIYLTEQYDKDWEKIFQKFRFLVNKRRTITSLIQKYNEIVKQGKLQYYQELISKKNFNPKLEEKVLNKNRYWTPE